MPFPLPWFDNNVDPTLPKFQNIKPYLYSLDEYQTYDVLVFICPIYLYYPFAASLELPTFFRGAVNNHPSYLTPILIERFTPWDYPWAEEYSTKIFNLFNKYSYHCPYDLDIEPTQEFVAANKTKFRYSSSLQEVNYPYTLKISYTSQEDDVIVITWLEGIAEVIKRYKILEIKKGENNLEILFPDKALAFSMVISDGSQAQGVESEIGSLYSFLLYKNLDSFIAEVDGFLGGQLGGFLKNFAEKKRKYAKRAMTYLPPDNERVAAMIAGITLQRGYAALLYANNNYWGNQININIEKDLGKKVFYQAVYEKWSDPPKIIWIKEKLEATIGLDVIINDALVRWMGGDIDLQDTSVFPYDARESNTIPPEVALAFYDAQKILELQQEDATMPDTVRIKEIHEALNAYNFAYSEGEAPRVANLGYYVERIARVLGISVNPDGSVRSIRQSAYVPQGEEIPAGWSIGQWGRNQGASSEGQKGGNEKDDRDGLAYEVRSGRFDYDTNTGEPTKITEGGYVLVENLPQLLHILMDDFDKAIGMQDAGAFAIPSADKTRYSTFEGMASFNAEILYMLSALSINIRQSHVSSLKNQAMLMEVLAALGTPIALKQFKVDMGEKEPIPVPYPGLREDAPSMVDFFVWVLSNLAPLVAAQLSLNPTEKDQSENQSDWSGE